MLITEIKSINDITETKTYLPLMEKELIINKIIDTIVDYDENNLVKIDFIHLDFFFDLEILKSYFSIEIPKDIETINLLNAYDYLCENDIVSQLKTRIDEDYEYLVGLLDKEIKQKIEINNSISAVLSKTLNKIASSLPDEKSMQKIINSIPKAINKIDKGNLEAITSALGGKKLGE